MSWLTQILYRIFLSFERSFVFTIFFSKILQPKIKIENLNRNNNDFTLFLPLSLKHEFFVKGRGPAKINIYLSCKQAFTLAIANVSKERMNWNRTDIWEKKNLCLRMTNLLFIHFCPHWRSVLSFQWFMYEKVIEAFWKLLI